MHHLLKDPSLFRAAAYVGGKWIEQTPHGMYTLRNPANDAVLVDLPRFKEAETTLAVEVAHEGFLSWRKTTAKHRSEILRRWYELMLQHKDDLATLITLEEGKPLEEAKGEVDYAASFIQWFSEEAKRVRGDVIPSPRNTARMVVLKEPIGVCAAITPWNFPAAMIARKAGPALAAGCSMVVKPASQTPLTALALAELAHRAGIPPGLQCDSQGHGLLDALGDAHSQAVRGNHVPSDTGHQHDACVDSILAKLFCQSIDVDLRRDVEVMGACLDATSHQRLCGFREGPGAVQDKFETLQRVDHHAVVLQRKLAVWHV
jgi:delta 1-pyrroline-5-carboxylate dehydrogenase